MKSQDILRWLGLGCRRIRDRLGLGDRRRPAEDVDRAVWQELDRLAWIKWRGCARVDDDPGMEDWGGHA